MTLGSTCPNSLSGQERSCVVLDGRTLHPERAAGIPGAGYAHGLQVQDVNLKEVAGCQLLMPGTIPSPLHFAWFYQSSSFINLDDS